MKKKSIFMTCILAVFMLAQLPWQLAGISVKTWLVWLAAVVGGLLWLYGKRDGGIKRTILINLLAVALLGNILQILWEAASVSGCEESSLLTVALLMLFYLIYTQIGYRHAYVWIVLLCGAVLYGGLLWNFMEDPSYTFGLRPLLADKQALVSLLLFVNVAAAEAYCREEEQVKRIFCLIMAAVGYFLLFAVRDIIGMAILAISFLVSVVVHKPEQKYIRRIMQMMFLYFFLLSNMSLLTNYTSLIKTEVSYSLEDSIYLDMAIAIAGSVFFAWWDRMPEREKLSGENFRLAMGWILAGCGILLVLFLLPGGCAEEAGLCGSAALLSRIAEELRQAAQRPGGVFYDVLFQYGIAGAVWMASAVMIAGRRLRELYFQKNMDPEAIVLFLTCLIQSVFYSQQPVTAPIYIVFTAMALHGRDEKTAPPHQHGREEKILRDGNAENDRKERKRRERDKGKQIAKEDMEIWDEEMLFSDSLLPDSYDMDLLYISHKNTGGAGAGADYQHNSDVRRDQGERSERSRRIH